MSQCMNKHTDHLDQVYYCTRPRGHRGVHIERSLSGAVLRKWANNQDHVCDSTYIRPFSGKHYECTLPRGHTIQHEHRSLGRGLVMAQWTDDEAENKEDNVIRITRTPDPKFDPRVRLEPEMLGYLKAGETVLLELYVAESGRSDIARAEHIITKFGYGRQLGLVVTDMDGWVVSEDFGEIADLRAGRKPRSLRMPQSGRYINVRRTSHPDGDGIGLLHQSVSFTVYARYVNCFWVSPDLDATIKKRIEEVKVLRKGDAASRKRLAAQKDLEEAQRLLREAQSRIADAEQRLMIKG